MIMQTRFTQDISYIEDRPYTITELLILSKIATDKAEAKRLVYQGQIKVNGEIYNSSLLLDPIYIKSIIVIKYRSMEVAFEKI